MSLSVLPSCRIPKPKLFGDNSQKSNATTRALFSLPYEIRSQIYFLVLRPDCLRNCNKSHVHQEGSQSCLNLLVTCSNIYVEAIEILHCLEKQVIINSTGMPIFRNAKDYGKPLQFFSLKSTSRCRVPARYSELEFSRFRKVEFRIDLRRHDRDHRDTKRSDNNLIRSIAAIAEALSKMTHVKQFRLNLKNAHDIVEDILDGERQKNESLLKFLRAMAEKKATLLLDSNEKLLEWIQSQATHLKLQIEITSSKECFHEAGWASIRESDNWQSDNKESAVYDGQWEKQNERRWDHGGTEWNLASKKVLQSFESISGILADDFIAVDACDRPYQLIPECRSCLKVFSNWAKLVGHLATFPGHQVKYQARQLNKVAHTASRNANRKCWTCAAGFANLEQLERHLSKSNHRRYGIIPHYIEDNDRYKIYGKG